MGTVDASSWPERETPKEKLSPLRIQNDQIHKDAFLFPLEPVAQDDWVDDGEHTRGEASVKTRKSSYHYDNPSNEIRG